jgi:chromosome segregation protein
LEGLQTPVEGDPTDAGVAEEIAALEASLAELEREREQQLSAQVASLKLELSRARGELAVREEAVEHARAQRDHAEERVEHARAAVHQAERAAESARLEAARVGAELAAVNQFLRAHAARPGGASVLADELEVDDGYELALAAALDGRLGAAIVPDRRSAESLLDSAGSEGGRALIAEQPQRELGQAGSVGPGEHTELLADRVRCPAQTISLVRALLGDTWVVESLDAVPSEFTGTAVTRTGRVWSARAREVRQAPALGEERALAERNRRERLIAASEAAASAELAAGAELKNISGAYETAHDEREKAVTEHRAAGRQRDEAAEDARRIESSIERRRSAPDDAPREGLRTRLIADIASKRAELDRAERDRVRRESQIARVREWLQSDRELGPTVTALAATLDGLRDAIVVQQARFEAALAADREAGEDVAAQLRACAQEEAGLQATLHASSEALTEAEVRLGRARDRAAECGHDLTHLADRLGLEAAPAAEELPAAEREALRARLERLTRRRELIGPVNPLAGQEYAEALEHAEELERQRTDLETALRELRRLIADTDRQIRETFEQTFESAARNFEEVAAQLFPGGRGRLRLVSESDKPARLLGDQPPPAPQDADDAEPDGEDEDEDEELLGVEIEINPAGKEMKRLSLLSGGEKSLTALAFLFAVFLASPCPFYILDEVEAALDDLNIDRFLALLRSYSERSQFIVVTHQRRTMEAADSLYGVSMGGDGISKVISRKLPPDQEAAA